jgi:hypothetical protein
VDRSISERAIRSSIREDREVVEPLAGLIDVGGQGVESSRSSLPEPG